MHESTTIQVDHWIHRLRQGDDAARARLIECACGRLERMAHRMLGRSPRVRRWEETADVAQNASMRLYKALQVVTPASSLDFFRLAAVQIRRELIDLARHYYGPQGPGEGPALPGREPGDHTYDPAELTFWTEVHQLIEGLPEEERILWDLLWYQGLSQQEAARVLNTSQPSVARRWRSARLLLQHLLPGKEPGQDP
jgi:RNA polymerase sigma factor (sigma-70 family)